MSKLNLNAAWLSTLLPEQKKFALRQSGAHFLYKFLFKKGHHLFVVGTTESGKTQKLYWVVRWIKTTKETVVWLDSAKNSEMLPLFTMGMPVRIICPKGCSLKFSERDPKFIKSGPCCGEPVMETYHTNKGDVEHQVTEWVPMKNPPEVIEVPNAGSAWWAVKKGHINIMCFRRAFSRKTERIKWMADFFTSLSEWTGKGIMPHILPMALFGDEAHWFVAGEKLTSDQERGNLSELITELSLEDRAYGIRLVLSAQGFKNLTTGARENLINVLLCRGAKVDSNENNTLSEFNNITSRFQPKEGLFVYAGGFTYPKGWPWPFPFFEKPKIRVQYIGEFDNPSETAIVQEEVEQEMIPYMGKYSALVQDLRGYEPPHEINRYEVIPSD